MCKLSTPSSSLGSRKGNIKGGTSLASLTKKSRGPQIPQKKYLYHYQKLLILFSREQNKSPVITVLLAYTGGERWSKYKISTAGLFLLLGSREGKKNP